MEKSRIDINDNVTIDLRNYADMVRRICFIYLRSKTDIDDIFQEVFLKLLLKAPVFKTEEHKKSWLIRISINQCKDFLKSHWRRNVNLEECHELPFEDKAENELMDVVLSLPRKYKDVIYLYYYEGYSVPQMAKILNQKENTIYSNLHRAKALIRQRLKGNENDYTF
jgi:RNA polymerase sigma-70 factor (ECF subfamily)